MDATSDKTVRPLIVLDWNGDPYEGGFVGSEYETDETEYPVYRGDIGNRSRRWWRQYCRRNGYRLREAR